MTEPPSCHVLGHGLACSLGLDMPGVLARLRRLDQASVALRVSREASPGIVFPYHAISDPAEEPAGHNAPARDRINAPDDWYDRARRLIRDVVAQCGPDVDRDAPLLVASSSLDVGALEQGASFQPDCQAFVEQVASWVDWRGPVFWVASACTSSLNAILTARRWIHAGAADEVMVLGMEVTNRFSLGGFGAMQLLDSRAARPLAADRAGMVLGEAVCAMRLGRRRSRWRLRGGANMIDGGNATGASRQAVADTVALALADSGLEAHQIDLIKLQAAGSPQNDAEEIAGLRTVFEQLPSLITLKPLLGHTLGASGVVELALLIGCLEAGLWPGACWPADASSPDPALGVTLADRRPARLRYLLAQILGFGGGHTCVLLEDREAVA